MAQTSITYICQNCGTNYKKWIGRCDSCQQWNTLAEEAITSLHSKPKQALNIPELRLKELNSKQTDHIIRYQTGIHEFDRVVGGGLVPGSALLISGDPGIGKSTLLLQISSKLSLNGIKTAYISGEESLDQVQNRAQRLKIENSHIALGNETSLEIILKGLKKHAPQLIIIDSIQTLWTESLSGTPGSVTQTRNCVHELIHFAKKQNICILFVGHVTKDGQIAGPRIIEHMVDSILYFEGDPLNQFRLLRTVKNRFGPSGEIGIFEMHSDGLSPVENPSSIFLNTDSEQTPGSAVFASIAGLRPVLTEIQALCVKTNLNTPRRAVVGWDTTRLSTVLAVLQARSNLNFNHYDVYLNIAGGLKISDPAADLAVAAALVSAYCNISLANKTVIFGELSLSGQVRPVIHTDMRLKESVKLGFCSALIPEKSKIKIKQKDFSCFYIKKLDSLIHYIQHINQSSFVNTENSNLKKKELI